MMTSKNDDPSVPMAPTPAVEGVDHNGLVVGKWKHGLFSSIYKDCVPNAVTPCLCPGVSMAQVSARLGLANFFMVLIPYVSVYGLTFAAAITKFDVLTTLAVIIGVLVLLFTIRIRFRMRYLFSIPGSLAEDIFASVFCCCCTVAQMSSHAESFEVNTFAVLPRSTLPGYTFG
ncbi:Transmembrane protein [Phytophthora megakarya]|uniref:Transmembrane protein n=1 Tax=Phytophthora megakarya TaxID=4795 RepID=A0A225W7Q9_9STRA|nr:Transmembrane protein [Phytophthora megakarya]